MFSSNCIRRRAKESWHVRRQGWWYSNQTSMVRKNMHVRRQGWWYSNHQTSMVSPSKERPAENRARMEFKRFWSWLLFGSRVSNFRMSSLTRLHTPTWFSRDDSCTTRAVAWPRRRRLKERVKRKKKQRENDKTMEMERGRDLEIERVRCISMQEI